MKNTNKLSNIVKTAVVTGMMVSPTFANTVEDVKTPVENIKLGWKTSVATVVWKWIPDENGVDHFCNDNDVIYKDGKPVGCNDKKEVKGCIVDKPCEPKNPLQEAIDNEENVW